MVLLKTLTVEQLFLPSCVREGGGRQSPSSILPPSPCLQGITRVSVTVCMHACVCARYGLGGFTHPFPAASRSPSSILIIPDVLASLHALPPFPSVFIIGKPRKLSSASLPCAQNTGSSILSVTRLFICVLDSLYGIPDMALTVIWGLENKLSPQTIFCLNDKIGQMQKVPRPQESGDRS